MLDNHIKTYTFIINYMTLMHDKIKINWHLYQMKYLSEFNSLIYSSYIIPGRILIANDKKLTIQTILTNMTNTRVIMTYDVGEQLIVIKLIYAYDIIESNLQTNIIENILSCFFGDKPTHTIALVNYLNHHLHDYLNYIIVGGDGKKLMINHLVYKNGMYSFTATIIDKDYNKTIEEIVVNQYNMLGWSSVDYDMYSDGRRIYQEGLLSPFFNVKKLIDR